MSIALVYSSKTGNTKKIADAIHNSIKEIKEFADVNNIDFNIDDFNAYILCYWSDKGTADEKMLAFIDKLSGKKVITIGTLGAYPDSEHAKKFKDNVRKLLEDKGNNVIGEFCCQGKIDDAIVERFKKLPEGHPHYMDEEKLKLYAEASKHPDENDINNAVECVKNALTFIK